VINAGAAKWFRRFEIALAASGLLFLGGAFAATAHRWLYQARQERAIFLPVRPITPPPPPVAPAVAEVTPPAAALPPPTRSPRRTIEVAADPLALGAVEIPRLGVRAIVREGVDDETLAIAVGHVSGTAHAGEKGNTVLAAHRDTFFHELENIRMNDRLRFVVPPNRYEYRVVSIRVVPPTETRVLDATDDEELTLVTCYPFHYIGNAPDRFVVRAARVPRR